MTNMTVPAADIIAESQRRGYLAKQLYIIETVPTQGIDPVMQDLADRLAFQESLERDGIMFAAGPLWTDDEEHWTGEGRVSFVQSPWKKRGRSRRATRCMLPGPAALPSGRGSSMRGW